MSLDGVSGTGAALRLDFMDPAGSMTGQLLPTGSAVDIIHLPDGRAISVSCIDAANPFVFTGQTASYESDDGSRMRGSCFGSPWFCR
jgi:2-methylaconitate cis-trans-isomerase PrpF